MIKNRLGIVITIPAVLTLLLVGALPAAEPAAPTGTLTATQAAASAAGIDRLIKLLGSEAFAEREAAQHGLENLGWPAIGALQNAARNGDPEIAVRTAKAMETIRARTEAQRDELRLLALKAAGAGDFKSAREQYLALLALPEPQLRDARAAAHFFVQQQDEPALASAYEVAAECMWKVTHLPVAAFIRPSPPEPPGRENGGGPSVEVQMELDGQWTPNARGVAENWTPTIVRKQKELVLGRIAILKKLGELCMTRLSAPARAVAAYQAAGRGMPLCEGPLEKLIAQMWPKCTVEPEAVLGLEPHRPALFQDDARDVFREGEIGSHLPVDTLAALAQAQLRTGDLRGAAETRLRAMLGELLLVKKADGRSDWNSHGPAIQAEAFWQVVRCLPAGEPLPPTLWLHVLDRDHSELDITDPESGPHGYPLSEFGPRLVVRPGQSVRTLTVSADMESPGGGGGVRCFTMIDNKVRDLGSVHWHPDKRQGREWITATFPVPTDAGIIRLDITPEYKVAFHVHEIKVRADFAPAGEAPAGAAAATQKGIDQAKVEQVIQLEEDKQAADSARAKALEMRAQQEAEEAAKAAKSAAPR